MDVYRDQEEKVEEPFIKVITTPETFMSVILEESQSECDDETECDPHNRYEETSKNISSNETTDDDDPDEESSVLIMTNHTIENV